MGDIDYFFENILPPISPELNINHIFDHCVKNEILTRELHSKNYSWKAVPKDIDDLSNRVYVKPFMKILHAVTKAAKETNTSNISRIPFIPIDGGKARLSDYDDYSHEEKLSPYVYVENRNVKFKGSIRNRHWYTSGFGFHFKGLEKDEIGVSSSGLFLCPLWYS